MFTIMIILAVAAFIVAVMSAMDKAPLWVSVILLCIFALILSLPVGK